jgi:hypothetical protein
MTVFKNWKNQAEICTQKNRQKLLKCKDHQDQKFFEKEELDKSGIPCIP